MRYRAPFSLVGLVGLLLMLGCPQMPGDAPQDIPEGDPGPSDRPDPNMTGTEQPTRPPKQGDSIAISTSRSVVPTGILDPCANKVSLAFTAPPVTDLTDQGLIQSRLDGSLVQYRIAEVRQPDGTLVYDFSDPASADPAVYGTLSGNCANGVTLPQELRNVGNHRFEADYFAPDFVAEPLQVTISFFGSSPAAAQNNARLILDDEFALGSAVVELQPPDKALAVDLAANRRSIVVPASGTEADGTVNATPSTTLTASFIGGTPDAANPDALYEITWLIDEQPVADRDIGPASGILAIDSDGDGVHDTFSSTLEVTATDALIGTPLFRAAVEDAKGDTASTVLAINVAAAMNIVLTSAPAQPKPGQIVQVTAGVAGGIPPYQYSWTNSVGKDFENQEVVDAGTASIVSLRLPDDASDYDVEVTIEDQQGNQVRQSLADQLGGGAGIPLTCKAGDEPTIVTHPTSAAGDPAVFSVVVSSGIDGGLFALEWQRNLGNGSGFQPVPNDPAHVPTEAIVTTATKRTVTATLTITPVNPTEDGGYYRLVATNECGSATSNTAALD